ncbi:MAG: glycosyltransferase family 4 protein [Candidatus Komeilibacteria bacterium]
MKIAFIGQKGIPAKAGGVERYVEAVATGLVKQGQQVFVYTRPYYSDAKKNIWRGVNLISLPSWQRKHWDAITHVALATWHALWQDYDIIHYQGVGPSLLSWIPRIFKPSTKVLVTFHSLDRKHAKWSLLAKLILRLAEWTACAFPHQTITVSKALQEYCLYHYNKPTTYIPNGVATNLPVGSKTVLSKFALRPYRYFIVISRLVAHKRVEDIISAWFKAKLPQDYKLVIVGSGSYTNRYEKKLRVLTAGQENIIFTGVLTGSKLFTLLAKATGFVSASLDEGMPITVLEAMSLATPLLLSDILGHRELIENLEVITFAPGDTESIAQGMANLAANVKFARKTAKQGQVLVRAQYNWEDIVNNLIVLYSSEQLAPRSLSQTLF